MNQESKNIKNNRRKLLKYLLWGMTLPFVLIIDNMMRNSSSQQNKSKIKIAVSELKDITFADDIVIIVNAGKTEVFSSRCTHLGCKIEISADGNLRCPCHGSKYDRNGLPLNGPASEPLPKKEFYFDKGNEFIYIIADK